MTEAKEELKPWPLVVVNDDGIRPAGRPDECFYCHQRIGAEHERDCVIVQKKIKARYVFEVELLIPHFWDAETFEFHRNESSWCARNGIGELERAYEEDCPCSQFRAEWIEEVDTTPTREVTADEA